MFPLPTLLHLPILLPLLVTFMGKLTLAEPMSVIAKGKLTTDKKSAWLHLVKYSFFVHLLKENVIYLSGLATLSDGVPYGFCGR